MFFLPSQVFIKLVFARFYFHTLNTWNAWMVIKYHEKISIVFEMKYYDNPTRMFKITNYFSAISYLFTAIESIWVGGKRASGVQKWIGGSSIPNSLWHSGEPNNSGDSIV